MDPADVQLALSGHGAAMGNHEQAIRFTMEQTASLARSVNTLVQRLDDGISTGEVGGVQRTVELEVHICNPERYDGDLNKCQGLLLQWCLVFTQRARLFPTQLSMMLSGCCGVEPWRGLRLVLRRAFSLDSFCAQTLDSLSEFSIAPTMLAAPG